MWNTIYLAGVGGEGGRAKREKKSGILQFFLGFFKKLKKNTVTPPGSLRPVHVVSLN